MQRYFETHLSYMFHGGGPGKIHQEVLTTLNTQHSITYKFIISQRRR